jgi:hypothetical protein
MKGMKPEERTGFNAKSFRKGEDAYTIVSAVYWVGAGK